MLNTNVVVAACFISQFTPAGTFATVPLDVPVACSASAAPLSVASDGTNFLVTWSTTSLYGLRVGPDGAGVLALGYRRALAGGVGRAQVRVFNWDTSAGDGGVDAGAADGGIIVMPPLDAGAPDAGVADAGTRDTGVVMPTDVPARDSGATAADVPVATADAGVPPTDDGGGCSVSGGAPPSRGSGVVAGLLGLAVAARRRKRAGRRVVRATSA